MNSASERNQELVTQAAAEWFVQLRDNGANGQVGERFAAWLVESPLHVQEYLAIARVYGDLARVDPGHEVALSALRAALLDEGSVVDFARAPSEPGAVGRRSRWKRAGRVLAATACLLLLVFVGIFWAGRSEGQSRFETAVGEQRSMPLQDGSLVQLNTNSKLEVRMSGRSRFARLVTGEVFFEVKRDPARPFVVDTGDALVKVYGTSFNIYRQAGGSVITVITGAVAVSAGDDASRESARTLRLVAGEQVKVAPDKDDLRKVSVDAESIVAWRHRKLVFDDAPLAVIVEEFNRYSKRKLVIGDDALASLKVSGVFQSDDVESLIDFLTRAQRIKVTREDGGKIVLSSG